MEAFGKLKVKLVSQKSKDGEAWYVNRELDESDLYRTGFRWADTSYERFTPVLYSMDSRHTPVVFLRVRINLEERTYVLTVMRDRKSIDSTYYTEYGNTTEYKKQINNRIISAVNQLCEDGILVRRR